MNDLFWLTIILFIVAAALRSEIFFYMLYVVVGLQVLMRFWLHRNARGLTWRRQAPTAAFPGEPLTVDIELTNQGVLPIPWVSLSESIPAALRTPALMREVISLGAGERRVLSYTINSRQRGYYQLGPLSLRTGDVLGLRERSFNAATTNGLTIYPTVLPLGELGLPASLPYGTLATQQRLFSDPARPVGVRPYQAADGVRRIDWKTTAHANEPQVRRYQPAIALETLIALAFTREEFHSRYIYDVMERALVAAASIAADLIGRGQPVGLCTTGRDPLLQQGPVTLPIGTGRAHLITLLGTLGRLEPGGDGQIQPLLQRASARLGWGSTLVLITGQSGIELLAALLPLRQRGLNIALILIDPSLEDLGLPRQHGIATYGLWHDGRPAAVS